MAEKSVVDAIVASPSESLTVEIKTWIDPTQPAGIAKIAKGAMALRNRNGGFFVIGFDDKTLTPDTAKRPANAEALFHVDVIQGIISKYASEPFEVTVNWSERQGASYPVLSVPSGVKVPVAAKRELKDGSQILIRNNTVYFRSLSSNGTVSTTEALARDWPEIVEICFDNREADVGRFIRRHLPGLDLGSLLKFSTSQPQAPTLCDRALSVIDAGESRYKERIKNRKLSAEEKPLVGRAFWSVALVVDPPRQNAIANQEVLDRLAVSNPRYTGWPIWMDARTMSDAENRAKVREDAFEYLVVSASPEFSDHIDFARLDPKGEFFLHRLLQDDGVPARIRPGRVLDPTLMILRVAEAMAVGIALSKALGCEPEKTTLGFAFRWHQLSGRSLTNWANQQYIFRDGGKAHDDVVETCVQFPLETPLSALPQFVDEATKRLFAAFDGATVPIITTEDLVKKLIERRLL